MSALQSGAGRDLQSQEVRGNLPALCTQPVVLSLQGIAGHGYYDDCTVPIIENTARECELTERLRQAIKDYPKSQAVLVRRHGVYVWGPTWIQAKTQAECYDYLFDAAVKMKAMGIDASQPATKAPAAQANGIVQNGHAHGTAHRHCQCLCCCALHLWCSSADLSECMCLQLLIQLFMSCANWYLAGCM